MSDKIELIAEPRQAFGKAAMRRMRRLDAHVPAIIYGAKKDPLAIQIPFRVIKRRLEDAPFYSSVLEIKVGKKTEKVILKEVQRHPGRGDVIHVDFLRIDEKKALTIHVPLHFLNEEKSPGVKAGGVASHLMNEIEVSCLPGDIPEFIGLDIGSMEMGDVLHVSDIQLPKGVELATPSEGEYPVVSVAEPKAEVELEVEEAAETQESEKSEGKSAEAADQNKGE